MATKRKVKPYYELQSITVNKLPARIELVAEAYGKAKAKELVTLKKECEQVTPAEVKTFRIMLDVTQDL